MTDTNDLFTYRAGVTDGVTVDTFTSDQQMGYLFRWLFDIRGKGSAGLGDPYKEPLSVLPSGFMD